MVQQRKIEIEEDAIRAQPTGTNSTALWPSFARENVRHALGSDMTGSMELFQVVMRHGPADDVVVAGAPAHRIARWVTRTSGSDEATARVDRIKVTDGCCLYIAPPLRRCSCKLLIAIQNLRNCTFPQT